MLKIVCFCWEGGRGKRYVRGGETVIYLARGNFFNGTEGGVQESELRTRKTHSIYNLKKMHN